MKNIKTINKQASMEMDIPENVIAKVNSFYWKEVVHKLAMPETQRIWIKELGLISVSPHKIRKSILSRISGIRRTINREYKTPEKKQEVLDYRMKDLSALLLKRKISFLPDYNEDKIFSRKSNKEQKAYLESLMAENKAEVVQDERGKGSGE